MSSTPLVSIISSCYNGEKYITRFLDAILNQSYDTIELILVNDGSDDDTENIIMGYMDRFTHRGYEIEYIFQQNGGVASAINNALSHVNGKYIAWFDSDDVPYESNIATKVEYFEHHHECGMVFGKGRIIDEGNMELIAVVNGVWADNTTREYIERNDNSLFYNLIARKGGCYSGNMLRTEAFEQHNPDKSIYHSQRLTGQNWQLMLPVIYFWECGYIDEVLIDYYHRKKSHSKSAKTFDELITKTYSDESVLLNTLDRIDTLLAREYYIKEIQKKYSRKRLKIAWQHKCISTAKEQYTNLKQIKCANIGDSVYYYRTKHRGLDLVCHCVLVCRRTIKRLIKNVGEVKND